MPADSPPLPWPEGAPFQQRLLTFIKISPITALLIFTIISLIAKENFPFSNYPMYSNPSAERSFYMVSGVDGKPMPVATLTGITCPKIGKMFRKKASDRKLDDDKLAPAQAQAIGMEIFGLLREQAQKLKQPLPERLRLTRIYITYANKAIVERPVVLAEEPVPTPNIP